MKAPNCDSVDVDGKLCKASTIELGVSTAVDPGGKTATATGLFRCRKCQSFTRSTETVTLKK